MKEKKWGFKKVDGGLEISNGGEGNKKWGFMLGLPYIGGSVGRYIRRRKEDLLKASASDPDGPLLRLENLVKIYDTGAIKVLGLKKINLTIGRGEFVAIMGHSGSGKSTLTHAKHGGKYDIKVLHDDAFIINTETCASIALEPTYFDKTADYPTGCPDNTYLLTAQNCAATRDEDGKIQLVTEDIRNGNGRAIKSKLWSPNRVDKIDEPVNAIFWIMKDPTIPPVVKQKGASLASVMGATLATKRSSAERLAPGVDPNKLVVVPYANPFRTYPLVNDYEKFKKLVEEKNVDCYIVNTGDFMGKKVKPADTLGILEAIVEKRATFHQWGPVTDIEIMDWEGFVPDMNDPEYLSQLKARMQDRLDEITAFGTEKGGYDKLPDDAIDAIKRVIEQLA